MKKLFLRFFCVLFTLVMACGLALAGCAEENPDDGGDDKPPVVTPDPEPEDNRFRLDASYGGSYETTLATVDKKAGLTTVSFDPNAEGDPGAMWGFAVVSGRVSSDLYPYLVAKITNVSNAAALKLTVMGKEYDLFGDFKQTGTLVFDLRTPESGGLISNRMDFQLQITAVSASEDAAASVTFESISFAAAAPVSDTFSEGWTVTGSTGESAAEVVPDGTATLTKTFGADFSATPYVGLTVLEMNSNAMFSLTLEKDGEQAAVWEDYSLAPDADLSRGSGFTLRKDLSALGLEAGEYEVTITVEGGAVSFTALEFTADEPVDFATFDADALARIDDKDAVRLDAVDGALHAQVVEDAYFVVPALYNINAYPTLEISVTDVTAGDTATEYSVEIVHLQHAETVVPRTGAAGSHAVNLREYGFSGEIGFEIRVHIYGTTGNASQTAAGITVASLRATDAGIRDIRVDEPFDSNANNWAASGGTMNIAEGALTLSGNGASASATFDIDAGMYRYLLVNVRSVTGEWSLSADGKQIVSPTTATGTVSGDLLFGGYDTVHNGVRLTLTVTGADASVTVESIVSAAEPAGSAGSDVTDGVLKESFTSADGWTGDARAMVRGGKLTVEQVSETASSSMTQKTYTGVDTTTNKYLCIGVSGANARYAIALYKGGSEVYKTADSIGAQDFSIDLSAYGFTGVQDVTVAVHAVADASAAYDQNIRVTLDRIETTAEADDTGYRQTAVDEDYSDSGKQGYDWQLKGASYAIEDGNLVITPVSGGRIGRIVPIDITANPYLKVEVESVASSGSLDFQVNGKSTKMTAEGTYYVDLTSIGAGVQSVNIELWPVGGSVAIGSIASVNEKPADPEPEFSTGDPFTSADGWSGLAQASAQGNALTVTKTIDNANYAGVQKTYRVNVAATPYLYIDVTNANLQYSVELLDGETQRHKTADLTGAQDFCFDLKALGYADTADVTVVFSAIGQSAGQVGIRMTVGTLRFAEDEATPSRVVTGVADDFAAGSWYDWAQDGAAGTLTDGKYVVSGGGRIVKALVVDLDAAPYLCIDFAGAEGTASFTLGVFDAAGKETKPLDGIGAAGVYTVDLRTVLGVQTGRQTIRLELWPVGGTCSFASVMTSAEPPAEDIVGDSFTSAAGWTGNATVAVADGKLTVTHASEISYSLTNKTYTGIDVDTYPYLVVNVTDANYNWSVELVGVAGSKVSDCDAREVWFDLKTLGLSGVQDITVQILAEGGASATYQRGVSVTVDRLRFVHEKAEGEAPAAVIAEDFAGEHGSWWADSSLISFENGVMRSYAEPAGLSRASKVFKLDFATQRYLVVNVAALGENATVEVKVTINGQETTFTAINTAGTYCYDLYELCGMTAESGVQSVQILFWCSNNEASFGSVRSSDVAVGE